jgi:ribosomal protein S18 acetylase RimI-like enzyme
MLEICIRPARIEDIPQLMELLGIASYGFIEHLFTTLSEPGADVRSAIKSRMEDPESQLSLRKTMVAEIDGQVAGFIMCEELPDPANLVSDDTHPLLRPLFELESMAPGTTLVNFVATHPELRGHRVGTILMDQAENGCGPNGMSLTIHDQNIGARNLYERRGFQEVARRKIVKQGWSSPATEWVLMTKA